MMSYTNYLLYLILVLCFTTDVGTINFRGQRTSAQNRHQSVCDLDVYWKLSQQGFRCLLAKKITTARN